MKHVPTPNKYGLYVEICDERDPEESLYLHSDVAMQNEILHCGPIGVPYTDAVVDMISHAYLSGKREGTFVGVEMVDRTPEPADQWFKFTSPTALTQHGRGTEEQARTYAEMRSQRFPGTTFVEIESEPSLEEAPTVVNLEVAIDVR
jgi:hypothetical protein